MGVKFSDSLKPFTVTVRTRVIVIGLTLHRIKHSLVLCFFIQHLCSKALVNRFSICKIGSTTLIFRSLMPPTRFQVLQRSMAGAHIRVALTTLNGTPANKRRCPANQRRCCKHRIPSFLSSYNEDSACRDCEYPKSLHSHAERNGQKSTQTHARYFDLDHYVRNLSNLPQGVRPLQSCRLGEAL